MVKVRVTFKVKVRYGLWLRLGVKVRIWGRDVPRVMSTLDTYTRHLLSEYEDRIVYWIKLSTASQADTYH